MSLTLLFSTKKKMSYSLLLQVAKMFFHLLLKGRRYTIFVEKSTSSNPCLLYRVERPMFKRISFNRF